MTRLSDLEYEIENLRAGFANLQDECRDNNEYPPFCRVRQANAVKAHRAYMKSAAKVADDWEEKDTPCRCGGDHNLIRFQGDGVWYSICPIKYYILRCWKAVHRNMPVPSREEILGNIISDENEEGQCQVCKGMGYVRRDVARDDEDFGKLHKCSSCAK